LQVFVAAESFGKVRAMSDIKIQLQILEREQVCVDFLTMNICMHTNVLYFFVVRRSVSDKNLDKLNSEKE
jgi:hypothetical protein